MKKTFSVLLVAVLSLFAVPAFAGIVYVSGSGGFTGVEDSTTDYSLEGSAVSLNTEVSFEAGWNAGGAIGYDFGMFRTDFEFGYRKNGLESITWDGISESLTENITVMSYLANGYFDFDTSTAFTPYVGFGVGFANIEIPADTDSVFAYKITAGLEYALSPAFSLTGDYTFFGTSDSKFTDSGVTIESEYDSHNINAGIRLNF